MLLRSAFLAVAFSIAAAGTVFCEEYQFSILASFNGVSPNSLRIASNGTIYGTADEIDGSYGTVFVLEGNTIQRKAIFAGEEGYFPRSAILSSSGVFFGVTEGTPDRTLNYAGTVFKADSSSTFGQTIKGFSIFAPQAGFDPYDVTEAGGLIYGVTRQGGASSGGTLFTVHPQTGMFSTIASFDATTGSAPSSLVAENAGNLYGTTAYTVFKVPSGSTTIAPLFQFGPKEDGSDPSNLIVDTHGNLYGACSGGGAFGHGLIFKIDPVLPSKITVASINYQSSDAAHVAVDSSGIVYAATRFGGVHGKGRLFKVADGAIQPICDFDGLNGEYGESPMGIVCTPAGDILGITRRGGLYGDGAIFKLKRISDDPGNPTDPVIIKVKMRGTFRTTKKTAKVEGTTIGAGYLRYRVMTGNEWKTVPIRGNAFRFKVGKLKMGRTLLQLYFQSEDDLHYAEKGVSIVRKKKRKR